MTNHIGRLYALALSLVALFAVTATIAASPWQARTTVGRGRDPQLVALQAREQRLRREAVVVRRVVARRWTRYRVALAQRRQEIARSGRAHTRALAAAAQSSVPSPPSAPSVRVVSLPPITVTRTS